MPRDTVIENPVINSPFRQPTHHFRFAEDGITSDVVDCRRSRAHFVPIGSARKRGGQQTFETEWTSDRLEQNPTINRIRERVWVLASRAADLRAAPWGRPRPAS